MCASNLLQVGALGRPAGTVEVNGVLRNGESGNRCAAAPRPCSLPPRSIPFGPCRFAKNVPAEDRYVWLDLPAMAAAAGATPVLVCAVDDDEQGKAAAPGGASLWPIPRPLESFLDFHVTPDVHLVRLPAASPALIHHGGCLPSSLPRCRRPTRAPGQH